MRNTVEGLNGAGGAAYVNGNGMTNGNGALSHRQKMNRKASSPMAPAFMVSAPGKVIVCGEHAVVHGKVRLWSLSFVGLLANKTCLPPPGRHRCRHLDAILPPRHLAL
ncbi:hypothetical protein HYQ45_018299 [Verticillium longisporum]|uniref:Mevalonate kinase n=1 Tax=Verticillium longisporum TaxID=100787 RepID=A0A8I3AGF5_VERLO|nr:hypothetical protein HYQ45_018299 [Verticillium longisporum]